MTPALRGSRPRKMFSATVMPGIGESSCVMMEILAASASAGLAKSTATPSTCSVPASRRSKPIRMFKKVDLPAPLPPHSACTEPARNARRPSRRAATPLKLLAMPWAWSNSGAAGEAGTGGGGRDRGGGVGEGCNAVEALGKALGGEQQRGGGGGRHRGRGRKSGSEFALCVSNYATCERMRQLGENPWEQCPPATCRKNPHEINDLHAGTALSARPGRAFSGMGRLAADRQAITFNQTLNK